ncbi:hypothetical protein J6590_012807 [Homalodisca vitripennis]|nr:hypothetical protein J6590_012807 [Homalodisca vitripennis]
MERGLLTIHYWWLVDGAILGVQCINRERLMRLSIKVQLQCGCCCERGCGTALYWRYSFTVVVLMERGLLTIHYWSLVDGAILGVVSKYGKIGAALHQGAATL